MRDTATLISDLITVGVDAVGRGLVLATGGNLSARVSDSEFVVTRSGAWLHELTPEDFVRVNFDGDVVPNAENMATTTPSSEWKLHQRAYQTRPDVECVIHLHPQHAVMLGSLGHPIRLFTLDHAFYVRSVGVTPFYHNGSDELADTAAEQLLHHDCVVMQHHGCSVVGDSVRNAYRRALNLEDAAKATALALQLGDTETEFPAEAMAALWHA